MARKICDSPAVEQDNQSGQAITEYVLLMAILASGVFLVVKGIKQADILNIFATYMKKNYAYTYRYGHPKARGYGDPDGPSMHPRIYQGGNFRIFVKDPGK